MHDDLKTFMTEWEREFATSSRVMGNLPPTKLDYRPDPKSMTAGELAWHIGQGERFGVSCYLAGKMAAEKGPEKPATLREIVQASTVQHQALAGKLREAPEEAWTRSIPFYGGMTLTGGQLLRLLAVNHAVHHRGQLSVYLRLMGAKVPSIYGPSADDKGAMQG